MLKNETTVNGHDFSRVCDTCHSASCTIHRRADSANYLCSGSDDACIHIVASRHGRVYMCEACERVPAVFFCKADATSLCSSCVVEIHSANPLVSRHHRVPHVLPISGCEEDDHHVHGFIEEGVDEENDDEAEAALWLLLNPLKKNDDNDESNGLLFGEVVDEYLDNLELVDCNSCWDNPLSSTVHYDDHQQHDYNSVLQKSFAVDSMVPLPVQVQHQQAQHFQQGLEFDSSKAAFSYNGSIGQSASISSMDVGIVPESTVSDASIFSHSKTPIRTIDLSSGPIQMPSYLTPLDREARVLRYKEKKKARKFEKKIRYTSRKAYAEIRPRINGRFAKRTDVETEVDKMFSTLKTEAEYSVVPSF